MWRYKWHHVFTGHWALDFRWSCWNQFRDLKTCFLVMKKNEKDPFEKLSYLHLRVLECWPHNLVIGPPHKPIELVSWFQKFQKSTGNQRFFLGETFSSASSASHPRVCLGQPGQPIRCSNATAILAIPRPLPGLAMCFFERRSRWTWFVHHNPPWSTRTWSGLGQV